VGDRQWLAVDPVVMIHPEPLEQAVQSEDGIVVRAR
jgi:hypothetical protein